MNKIFSYVTAFSFSIISFMSSLHASIDVPVHQTQHPKISETKIAIIKQICDLYMNNFLSSPDNKMHYFVKPIESEFKALGFPTLPFEQTLKKAIASTQHDENITKLIQEFTLNISLDILNALFSEEELKELLDVYKNPLLQKHIKFLGSGWFEPLIDVLKDPKLFQLYETKITQFIHLIKDPNTKVKVETLIKIGTEDFTTFADFIKTNAESLKEKVKTQFPAVAPYIIPFFEKKNTHTSQELIKN